MVLLQGHGSVEKGEHLLSIPPSQHHCVCCQATLILPAEGVQYRNVLQRPPVTKCSTAHAASQATDTAHDASQATDAFVVFLCTALSRCRSVLSDAPVILLLLVFIFVLQPLFPALA
jgi:hypothetical protein